MNEETINDLKQFIATTVSQQLTLQLGEFKQEIRQEIRTEIRRLDEKLSTKIDELSAYVAEALDNSNEETHKRLNNHEKRIRKLEAKAA